MTAVGCTFSLSWNQIDGIMRRAAKRDLARQQKAFPERADRLWGCAATVFGLCLRGFHLVDTPDRVALQLPADR